MATVARKAAPRPAKPVGRYWRGKAPKGVDVRSESESDEEAREETVEDGDVPVGGSEDEDEESLEMPLLHTTQTQAKSMNIALRAVDISKEGKVIVAGREESGRTVLEESEEEESEEEEAKPSVAQDEEESEESEEESESEEEPQPMLRPVFVPKRGRITVLEREREAQDTEEALERKRFEEEERRKQSHDMVAESIRRELLEKEKQEEHPDVDDTDGLDPDAEFEAWHLRELSRIKRDEEERLRRDLEREEIERRRALPEEQRMKEDIEHAKKTREDKPKGQQRFLQKYWHKGAFHQDYDVLKRHDYTQATESTVDVSLLPKVMQVRDFGKRSRTKYTHLLDQDTTVAAGGFGGVAPLRIGAKPGEIATGCFLCGGPHLKKDCPQNTGPPGTGANTSGGHSSSRKWGENGRDNRDRPRTYDDRAPRRDKWYERDGSDDLRDVRLDNARSKAPDRRDAEDIDRRREKDSHDDRDSYSRRDRRSLSRERYRERDNARYRRDSRSRSRSPPHRDSRREGRRRHSRENSPDDDHRRDKRIRTE